MKDISWWLADLRDVAATILVCAGSALLISLGVAMVVALWRVVLK